MSITGRSGKHESDRDWPARIPEPWATFSVQLDKEDRREYPNRSTNENEA